MNLYFPYPNCTLLPHSSSEKFPLLWGAVRMLPLSCMCPDPNGTFLSCIPGGCKCSHFLTATPGIQLQLSPCEVNQNTCLSSHETPERQLFDFPQNSNMAHNRTMWCCKDAHLAPVRILYELRNCLSCALLASHLIWEATYKNSTYIVSYAQSHSVWGCSQKLFRNFN